MFGYRLNHNMLHMEQVAATLPGAAKMPRIQRETFIHSNNQIPMCLLVAMLNMLNYQSQVTVVSHSLMKTSECKTYKM